jgi:hypothetical protein
LDLTDNTLPLGFGLSFRAYTLIRQVIDGTELKIGEVATQANGSVDALRYYERMKFLPRARRTSGGFRLFGVESIDWIHNCK